MSVAAAASASRTLRRSDSDRSGFGLKSTTWTIIDGLRRRAFRRLVFGCRAGAANGAGISPARSATTTDRHLRDDRHASMVALRHDPMAASRSAAVDSHPLACQTAVTARNAAAVHPLVAATRDRVEASARSVAASRPAAL